MKRMGWFVSQWLNLPLFACELSKTHSMGTLGDVEAHRSALHPLGDRPEFQASLQEVQIRVVDFEYDKIAF